MRGIVAIRDVEVPIVEWNGQRVVTFSMIDRVHCRPERTALRAFGQHRERFKCDLHYFRVGIHEIRERFPGVFSERATGEIGLITERGYLMLVKSFTDDLAWEVQERLVDAYFRVREPAANVAPAATDLRLPDFRSPAAAARAWAEQFELREASEKALAATERK